MADLPPGRELDALVAEVVMGWTFQQFPDGLFPEVKHWSPPGGTTQMLPAFSTDWRAAGEVLDRMRELGCHVQINAPGFYSDGRMYATFEAWYCLFQKGATEAAALFEVWGECETGQTGPHAIALAAAVALGRRGRDGIRHRKDAKGEGVGDE